MKKYFLLLSLIAFSISSFCQEKKLLEQFKFRTNRYNELFVNFASGGQLNSADFVKTQNFNNSFNASFFTVKSTDKFIQTFSVALAPSYNFSKKNDFNSSDISKYFTIQPSLNLNSKWFVQHKFFEVGFNANGTSLINKNINELTSIYTQNDKTNSINSNITLGFGTGRLENITDMQNAIWLIKNLDKEGNLIRKLSDKEINDLTFTITKAKIFRVLDVRRRTKFVLETIDNYLQTRGAIERKDISYFTNLNDIIFFANNFTRFSGKEKFIRISPALNYYKQTSEYSNPISYRSQQFNSKSIIARVGLQNFKPISLKRQFDYGVALKYQYSKNTDTYKSYSPFDAFESKFTNEINNVGFDYFMRYSIYPNTRTNIAFGIQGEAGKDITPKLASLFHQHNIYVNVDYFINNNTRVFFNVGGYLNQNDNANIFGTLYTIQTRGLYSNAGIKLAF